MLVLMKISQPIIISLWLSLIIQNFENIVSIVYLDTIDLWFSGCRVVNGPISSGPNLKN